MMITITIINVPRRLKSDEGREGSRGEGSEQSKRISHVLHLDTKCVYHRQCIVVLFLIRQVFSMTLISRGKDGPPFRSLVKLKVQSKKELHLN